MSDLDASYEAEHNILAGLELIHPGPWQCDACRQLITAETQWKPSIALIFNNRGASRAIIDIYCHACSIDKIPEHPRAVPI